jgi:hypothetical protein
VFANKTDVEGCMTEQEILSVSSEQKRITKTSAHNGLGTSIGVDKDSSLAHPTMQRHDW